MMQDPTVNFYDVKKEFGKSLHKYEKRMKKLKHTDADREEMEMPGLMQYKRWEWFTEPRVYPTGDRMQIEKAMFNVKDKLFRNSSANKTIPSIMQVGNWTLLGPTTVIPTNGGDAGRICSIEIDPTNSNHIFTGAPAGGLWESTNGGTSWSTNTDDLPVLGIGDISIDPTNTNIMYIGTGDADATDSYSAGVLKSTDGGMTWNITGLSFLVSQGVSVSRVLINPNNTNMIFAGTSTGVYRSLDAGATWVKTLSSGGIKDMEFMPGNPNYVYAAGTAFYRSTNGGTTFSTITSGIPSTGVSRLAIAVTTADSNYVYVLAGKSSNNGFLGLYRSTNGGGSFTLQSNSPNILGWAFDGSDVSKGGQAWYDLGLAASPTNKDEIVTGGINIWRSTNGGVSWTLNAHWQGQGAPYVHADVHTLHYLNATTVYAGCDGGVYYTNNNGTSWTDLGNGLQIAQMYRLGCAKTNANIVWEGWQDNGTNLWNAGTWSRPLGGDGMECFVDWSNSSTVYGEQYNGNLQRSINGGANWVTITAGISELANGAWVTPWGQDPKSSATIYAGYSNVWKSINKGSGWVKISSINAGSLQSLALAPSNPNYIYTAPSSNSLYKTTNGGSSWSTISTGLPAQSITYIAASGNDPNRVWVTFSGYNGAQHVYKTTNGGSSWTNVTYDLPNIPANCVVVDTTSAVEGIYVGTDLGVYYIDTTRTTWLPFNNGLPNVTVDELEIQYTAKKLRAATYGRGLWETSLYNASSLTPSANFKGNTLLGCPGMQVQFTDMSTNTPTSWNWTFTNGNPSSSTVQNPLVTYTTAGTWNDVKLVAANGNGSDSVTKYSYIGISPAVKPTTNPAGTLTICGTSKVYSSYGTSYKWLPTNSTNNFLNVTSTGVYQVIVTDMFGCSDTSLAVNVTVLPLPTPSVSATTTLCSGASATLTASGGNTYSWNATGQTTASIVVSPTATTNYVVTATDTNGCSATANASVVIDPIAVIAITSSGDTLKCNPSSGVSYQWYQNGVLVPGATQSTFLATTGDSCYVVITDTYGCSSQSIVVYTGVQENTIPGVNMFISPSVNSGSFALDVSLAEPLQLAVEIMDAAGRKIYAKELGTISATLHENFSLKLSKGIYFLSLRGKKEGDERRAVKKFIVE